jgi:hypothetical protein
LQYAPYFPGNFLPGTRGVYDPYPAALPLIPGKQGLIALPYPDLEVPVFIDVPGGPSFQAFQGKSGIKVKENEDFRNRKTGVKLSDLGLSAGDALIYQGRKGKTVGNHQFPPSAALYDTPLSVNMLTAVRREKPGQGFRPEGAFP